MVNPRSGWNLVSYDFDLKLMAVHRYVLRPSDDSFYRAGYIACIMQRGLVTRKLSVCLSVKHVISDKRKKLVPRFFYGRSFILVS